MAIMPPVVAPARVKKAPLAIQTVQILWDYPTNTPDVKFEIWGASTPKGTYARVAVVDHSPATLTREGFFLLRATNTVNHLVSNWASAAP